jgi:hypothetical protein
MGNERGKSFLAPYAQAHRGRCCDLASRKPHARELDVCGRPSRVLRTVHRLALCRRHRRERRCLPAAPPRRAWSLISGAGPKPATCLRFVPPPPRNRSRASDGVGCENSVMPCKLHDFCRPTSVFAPVGCANSVSRLVLGIRGDQAGGRRCDRARANPYVARFRSDPRGEQRVVREGGATSDGCDLAVNGLSRAREYQRLGRAANSHAAASRVLVLCSR